MAEKMVKAKVVKDFIDKYTGIYHKAGEEVSLTADRYREIKAKGYIDLASKPKAVAKEK